MDKCSRSVYDDFGEEVFVLGGKFDKLSDHLQQQQTSLALAFSSEELAIFKSKKDISPLNDPLLVLSLRECAISNSSSALKSLTKLDDFIVLKFKNSKEAKNKTMTTSITDVLLLWTTSCANTARLKEKLTILLRIKEDRSEIPHIFCSKQFWLSIECNHCHKTIWGLVSSGCQAVIHAHCQGDFHPKVCTLLSEGMITTKSITITTDSKEEKFIGHNINSLPDDVLLEIFQYLEDNDTFSVCIVCKRWKTLYSRLKTDFYHYTHPSYIINCTKKQFQTCQFTSLLKDAHAHELQNGKYAVLYIFSSGICLLVKLATGEIKWQIKLDRIHMRKRYFWKDRIICLSDTKLISIKIQDGTYEVFNIKQSEKECAVVGGSCSQFIFLLSLSAEKQLKLTIVDCVTMEIVTIQTIPLEIKPMPFDSVLAKLYRPKATLHSPFNNMLILSTEAYGHPHSTQRLIRSFCYKEDELKSIAANQKSKDVPVLTEVWRRTYKDNYEIQMWLGHQHLIYESGGLQINTIARTNEHHLWDNFSGMDRRIDLIDDPYGGVSINNTTHHGNSIGLFHKEKPVYMFTPSNTFKSNGQVMARSGLHVFFCDENCLECVNILSNTRIYFIKIEGILLSVEISYNGLFLFLKQASCLSVFNAADGVQLLHIPRAL